MSLFTTAQRKILDNLLPSLVAQGIQLGTTLESLNTTISGGALAIESDPSDVDAVCEGANAFEQNVDATVGLTFSYFASRFYNGKALVSVSAGSVTLTPSLTNYVEVDRSGTVSANTSGFTTGRLPLWTILAGVSTITTITSSKPVLTMIGTAGTTGDMLSQSAATRTIIVKPGTLSATSTINIPMQGVPGTISDIRISSQASIATDATNTWSAAITNLGTIGSGSTNVLSTTSNVNSTNSTGGSSITANVQRSLALSGTSANLNTSAKDMLQLIMTKGGSAANLTDFTIEVDLVVSN